MLFNSMAFSIFLPIVFILYWVIPDKYRWIILLISSYYFYMSWNPKFVFLILFTTAASYSAALLLEKYEEEKTKKLIIAVVLIVCLGILFLFKYFNFFSESLSSFANLFAIKLNTKTLDIIVPVGISFYTFQTLSYVIDVYRGDVPAEHHFGKYAAFISFFPQLVAGPIERTKNLLPQIKEKHKFDYEMASYGLKLMAWGFFKKLVVADNLSIRVDTIYQNINSYTGFSLVMVAFFFALQIYCDFSGYSDIAIGTANFFGIRLMTNFKSPYFSASIKEFWSRWHISLSSWFRDYVYIPMGGNRVSKLRHIFNILVTFLVSGLWHGAQWTYVAWGGVHGAAQIVEGPFLSFEKNKQRKHTLFWWIRVLVVFVFCCLAWVLFRADNLSTAIYVYTHMLDGIGKFSEYISMGTKQLGIAKLEGNLLTIVISMLAIFDYLSLRRDVLIAVKKLPVIVRGILYIAVLLVIIILSPLDSAKEFIYFQF